MIRLVSSMDLVHCSITVSIQPGDMVAIRRATASRTQRRPIRIDASSDTLPDELKALASPLGSCPLFLDDCVLGRVRALRTDRGYARSPRFGEQIH